MNADITYCKTGNFIDLIPHWIPCNERLPEELLPVLVAVRAKDRKAAWATEKSWHYVTAISALDGGAWDYYGDQVAAWMPLPEPYKGGERNE